MKTLKQIVLELQEIKRILQTIASSLELKDSVELPRVDTTSEYVEFQFNKDR